MLNDKEIVKRVQKIGKVQSIEAEKITAFYKFIQYEEIVDDVYYYIYKTN